MNLDGVDVFVKVIQCGSFTKAAALLERPVTTVSDKVALLEEKLGVTLIHRTTRQLRLTSIGEVYFEKCLHALSEIETAELELLNSRAEPQGKLRITMPVDVGHTIMPSLVKRFIHQYPKVQIELVVTNKMVDLIGDSIDLAIRVGNLTDSTYRVRKFIETTASIWATPQLIKKIGAPISVKQLEKYPYIGFFFDQNKYLELNSGKEKVRLNMKTQITADDLETVKKFVLNSDGVGLIPNYLCENEENNGSLVRLQPDWTRGKIALSFVYPSQKYVSANVKAFIDMSLQENLANI
jgi:DNA-binding transcriptional LysR family regulator